MNLSVKNAKIAIIGLGYVGLPLAVEFGKNRKTIGFDINQDRVKELTARVDSTLECSEEELSEAINLTYTASIEDINNCNTYIVTVPTPINKHKQPDLTPLIKASEAIGTIISEGDVVIFESTVYPGATEEVCLPVIEEVSGLTFNRDFYAGYSPERINPGDKEHRVTNILKVTSGSTPEIAEFVDQLYRSIIVAGTYKATSIKVAEASKVIENVQRDVNIALINELHQIFNHLNINTKEVIDAASTKWNFMKLMPGLVGGHCIGVDPYYLLHKAESNGYIPDLIRTSREINDTMAHYIANDFLKLLLKSKINPIDANVLLLGFSFKENCPDLRNTKNFDLYLELKALGFNVKIVDPWVNFNEAKDEYGVDVLPQLPTDVFDATLLAVGHEQFKELVSSNSNLGVVYNFKGLFE